MQKSGFADCEHHGEKYIVRLAILPATCLSWSSEDVCFPKMLIIYLASMIYSAPLALLKDDTFARSRLCEEYLVRI